MLFLYDDQFVEAVRENCYEGVITFCSSDLGALGKIVDASGTMGEPVQLHNQPFAWAIHVPEDRTYGVVSVKFHSQIEKVDRLTGPALAYAYDYLPLSESEKDDGDRWGEYGYCWPDELGAEQAYLYGKENPPDSEVIFIPIWTLPADLTGAPRNSIDADENEDSE